MIELKGETGPLFLDLAEVACVYKAKNSPPWWFVVLRGGHVVACDLSVSDLACLVPGSAASVSRHADGEPGAPLGWKL